jgi:hypothetical protein
MLSHSLTLSCSRANKKPEKFQRQKGGGGPFWSLCVSIQECEKMFCVRSEGEEGLERGSQEFKEIFLLFCF